MGDYCLKWLLFAPILGLALPQEGTVASGRAEFAQSDPQTMVISTSDKAILNYRSFDIGAAEKVAFVQPSESSCVLNRVQGSDGSTILGLLEGNGKVFLVNPNGVYFGPDSIVNTGSFVASTLDIFDQDFLDEKYCFRMGPGTEKSRIESLGTISAGAVALLAPHIVQDGMIAAKAGQVVLGCGEVVTLDFGGDGLIQFAVEAKLPEGDLFLRAEDASRVIRNIVNADGLIEGQEIVEQDGVVEILSRSTLLARGKIDVSGETGGGVQLLSDHIALRGAEIDASGDFGGGTVLVGGEYKGGGGLRTAITNDLDAGSVIRADALASGDGGRVIVWADDTTLFNGKVFVRGGGEGGDGGFVETSGKQRLGVDTGYVNALAPNGRAGDWLLDPTTIDIIAAGGCTLATAAVCGGAACSISAATINAAGANVNLCATAGITHRGGQNITLAAGLGINYQSDMKTTFNGTLGNITITTTGGFVTFLGGTDNAILFASGPTLTINTSGGNVTFGSTIDQSGTLVVNAGTGSILVSGAIGGATAINAVTFTASAISISNLGSGTTEPTQGVFGFTTLNASTGAGTITFTGTNYNTNQTQSYTASTSFNMTAGAATFFNTHPQGGEVGPLSFNTGTILLANSTHLTVDAAATTMGNIQRSGVGVPLLDVTFITGSSTVTAGGIGTSLGQFGTVTVNTGSTTILGNGGGDIYCQTFVNTLGNLNFRASLFTNDTPISFPFTCTISNLPAGTPKNFTITNIGTMTGLGAAITFSGTLNSDATANTRNLIVQGGAGAVSFSTTGNSARPTSITATSTTSITLNGSISVNGGAPTAVSLTAPTIILAAGGSINTVGTTTGGNLTITGNVVRSITTPGTPTFTTGTGNIVITGTVNADVGIITGLNLTATTGAVSVGGSIGVLFPFVNALTITGSSITLSGDLGIAAVAGASQLACTSTGPINLGGTNYRVPNGILLTAGANNNITLAGVGTTTLRCNTFTSTTSGTGSFFLSGGNCQINSGGANATLGDVHAPPGSLRIINFSHGVGTLRVGNIGGGLGAAAEFATVDLSNAGAIGALDIRGNIITNAISMTSANLTSVSVGGNIFTNNTDIAFPAGIPVVLDIFHGPTPTSITLDTNTGAGNVTFGNAVNADSTFNRRDLIINAGTGSVTFSNTVGNTGALSSLTISGAAVSVNNSLATSTSAGGTGAVIVTNTGTFTKGLTGAIVAPGGFSTTGNAVLGNNITTSNAFLTISGTLVLSTGALVTLTSAGGPLTVVGATNGTAGGAAEMLTLVAGTGTINMAGIFGAGGVASATGLTTVTVTSGGIQNFNGNIDITGALSQIFPATGTTTFAGTAAVGSAALQGTAFNMNNSFTATGAVTVANTGLLTKNSVGNIVAPGGFSTTGNVDLAANITTTGTALTIGGTLVLSAPAAPPITLSTGAGVGNITLSNTVNGAQSLTLTAGTGSVLMSGAVGGVTPLTSVVASGDIITQSSSVRTTGVVTYTATTQIQLGGNITTNSGIVTLTGPVLLNGGATAISTTGAATAGADIIFAPALTTIDGAQPFTLTSGVGNITLVGPVGSITPLGSFTINNGGTLTVSMAAPIVSNGPFAQIGTGPVSLAANITTSNDNITFAGPITLMAPAVSPITLNSGVGLGDILFGAASTIDGAQDLNLIGGLGTIQFLADVGAMTPLLSLTATAETIDQNADVFTVNDVTYGSVILLSGDITAAVGDIIFNSPVVRDGVALVTLTATLGNVDFNDTLDGEIGQTRNLTISAPAGDIAFAGAVGGLAPLTNLIAAADTIFQNSTAATTAAVTYTGTAAANAIQVANNITTTGGTVTMTGPVLLTGPVAISTAGGNIDFSTAATTINGAQNFSLTSGAGAITFNAAVGGITPLMSMTVNNGGTMTTVMAASITTDGPFAQTGAGTSSIAANITTSNDNISFIGPIVLTAPTAPPILFTAGTGGITLNNTVSGAQDLTLSALGGTIFGYQNIGTPPLTPLLDFIATADVICLFGSLDADMVTLTATTSISIGGAITTNNALTFNAPVFLSGSNLVFSTAAGGADITFNSTLDSDGGCGACLPCGVGPPGNRNLTLDAGAGDVIFPALFPVGSLAPPGDVVVSNAMDVFISMPFAAGSLSVNNTGMLTILAAGDINLVAGSFTQTGAASVMTAGDVTATGNISFSSPVTLTGDVLLASSGGNTTLNSTVDGAFSFTANAAGTVTFNAALGPALTSLSATGAVIDQNSTVFVAGDVTYTGTSQIGADITTTAANGDISINGNVIRDTIDMVTLLTVGAMSNITITGAIDGDIAGRDLTMTATGTATVGGAIGNGMALDLVVITGDLINLNNVGGALPGVTTSITAVSTNNINYTGTQYTASTQVYTTGAGSFFNMVSGSPTTFTTVSNSNLFNPMANTISLSDGSDLIIILNNMMFTLPTVVGTSFENVSLTSGTGVLTLGIIGSAPGEIGAITALGGQILLSGTINSNSVNFVSQSTISNLGAPMLIATGNGSFNALGGDVGALGNPINVNASVSLLSGAAPPDVCCSLAEFSGTTLDSSVGPIPSNPPCIIHNNATIIKSCIPPIIPPPEPAAALAAGVAVPNTVFYVQGVYSPLKNLAEYVYFLDDRADERVSGRRAEILMWVPAKGG